MLRKAVILLIALNLIWWVWARNWLAPVGLPATPAGSNPEYLARQIHPEAVSVQPLPPGASLIKTAPAAADDNADGKRHGPRR